MARIAESELERLKAEVSVARLIEANGIKLEKRGRDQVGRCPFHEDDTASLTITPEKNLFHCFGCGASVTEVFRRSGLSRELLARWRREAEKAGLGNAGFIPLSLPAPRSGARLGLGEEIINAGISGGATTYSLR